jgi:hypothetical protein
MTEIEGMKTYGAELTNARANAGAIVLYQHEEASLISALEGLNALKSARTAFMMVNTTHTTPHSGTVYDESQIKTMIGLIQTQLSHCQQRIQNMKKSFNHLTGLTWEAGDEKVTRHSGWTREEDEANGTVLLTKEV